QDWLLNLRVPLVALGVFGGTYLVTAAIWFAITRLAVRDRARTCKVLWPGVLPPLRVLFGPLGCLTAAKFLGDFEDSKGAVSNDVSALRSVLIPAGRFPAEQATHLRALITEHVQSAIEQEWPEMAQQRARLGTLPKKLAAALNATLSLTPQDDGQRLAQNE